MKNVFKIFGIVYLILCQFQDVTLIYQKLYQSNLE